MKTSQDALNMIVGFEITSPEVYEKLYQRPVWPGGVSGVTIGIGYDLGQHSASTISSDWLSLLPWEHVAALRSSAGIRGRAAKLRLRGVAHVVVPFVAAKTVFGRSLGLVETTLLRAWPGCETLPGDCIGALVSLFYNRGFDCNRIHANRQGMADLSNALSANNFTSVPGIIRAMQGIWQGKENALVERREKEAVLFQQGLATMNLNGGNTDVVA